MRKIHLIFSVILLLSVLNIFLEFTNYQEESIYVKALVVPVICAFYISFYKMQLPYFSIFLILFSIADFLTFFRNLFHPDFEYFLGNILYITAYLVLLNGVLRQMNFEDIMYRFRITIFVLLALNMYMLTSLYINIFPGDTVNLDPVSEPTVLTDFLDLASIMLEFVYNAVILVLLTVSFVNFLYRDNNRSLFLFVGSICLVFSEVIQYAINYPSEEDIVLNLVCYFLLVSGFMYFYLYAVQSDVDVLDSN